MYSNIFWEKRVGERFSTFFSDSNILADQKFYPVKLKEQSSQLPFLTSVNSTIERLFLEIDAVSYTGAYTLIEMSVNNAKNLKLINPTFLHQLKLDIQNKQFKSIFEECGIDPSKPIREQEPNPLPDRAALDNIVFDELGLTEEERKEVYWSVCELVKQRLEKVRSLRR
jgi:hypothetical protein